MRTLGISRVLLSLLILGQAQAAWAARAARVLESETAIYDHPSVKSVLLDKLAKDAPLSVSNYPSKGFYKVRTGAGLVGWVAESAVEIVANFDSSSGAEADALSIDSPMTGGETASTETAGDTVALPSGPSDARGEEGSKASPRRAGPVVPYFPQRPKHDELLGLRAFGSFNLFQAKVVNDFLGLGTLRDGFGYGGEVHFKLSPSAALVFRLEKMIKTLVAQDSSSGKVFQFEASAMPVMIGLEFTVSEGKSFSSYLGGFGGVSLNTTLQSNLVQSPMDDADATRFTATALTAYLRWVTAYHLSDSFQILGELGYRFLSTTTGSPAQVGTAPEIWQTNGAYQALAYDLGGFSVGFGAALKF